MILTGKVTVVTGASSGIGLDLAKRLLKEGAHVVAVSRSIESLDYDHEYLVKKNSDMSKETAIDDLFEFVLNKYGHIDVFIANAGFAYYEYFKDKDYNHIDELFKLNVYSVMYSAQKMKTVNEQRPYNFMTTSSAAGIVSLPGYAIYSASKAAISAFMDSYQLELDKDQTLQTVYPVATKTNFFNVAGQDTKKPWPVQKSDTVARAMVKGLKRNKKHIYPSKLFFLAYKLFPWFFIFYKKKQTKLFKKAMTKKDK